MTNQVLRHIFLHLRFGFSVFLLPVFLFAFSQSMHPDIENTLCLFFVLHFLVYPSSNGYNSYMDNDMGSIGGLKSPPKVPKLMFHVSLLMDALALMISFFLLNATIAFLILLYILASRAYSFRGIRLKKYAVIGFLTVAVFQGALVYLISTFAIDNDLKFNTKILFGMALSFLMIGSSYPLTQIYQHQQDLDDGVATLSYKLGIKGTFLFSMILLSFFTILFCLYFWIYYQNIWYGLLFIVCTIPVSIYFTSWMKQSFSNPVHADFDHTMKMNRIGSLCINLFFTCLIILKSL